MIDNGAVGALGLTGVLGPQHKGLRARHGASRSATSCAPGRPSTRCPRQCSQSTGRARVECVR